MEKSSPWCFGPSLRLFLLTTKSHKPNLAGHQILTENGLKVEDKQSGPITCWHLSQRSLVVRYCWYECLASRQQNTLVTALARNNPNQNIVLKAVTKSIWVLANHVQLEKYPTHWLYIFKRAMIGEEDLNGEKIGSHGSKVVFLHSWQLTCSWIMIDPDEQRKRKLSSHKAGEALLTLFVRPLHPHTNTFHGWCQHIVRWFDQISAMSEYIILEV